MNCDHSGVKTLPKEILIPRKGNVALITCKYCGYQIGNAQWRETSMSVLLVGERRPLRLVFSPPEYAHDVVYE